MASLTHWGRDQIDAISQTTLTNAFSRMKMNEFRLGFHWSLFLKARSHSTLRLNHGHNPSKSGLLWSRRCCSRWCRGLDELQSNYRRGRTQGKIGTASDAAKSFELLKILARGQPRVAHVVKTCNTRETHVIIRVPAVIKTWGDALRRERLGVCLGQSTDIGRVLHVGITGKSVCLAAYHLQMDFSVLRQCLGSA